MSRPPVFASDKRADGVESNRADEQAFALLIMDTRLLSGHYQAETRPDWDKHAAARSGAEARRLSATACVSLFLPQPLLLAWGGGGCMRICICLSSVSRKMAFVPVPRNLSLSDLQVPRLIDPPNRPGRFLRLSCLPLNSSLSATDMAFALHPGDYRARMRASVERVCL